MSTPAIKSMNLYSEVDRIHNDLAAIGIGPDDSLTVDVLSQFDQFHYFGTDAVDEAIAEAGINAKSRVLDIGSGLGGPARYLAEHTGCHVTAIELQFDLNALAESLTERCGLSAKVEHVQADVLTHQIEPQSYDAMVSWLCFYHIADHQTLLSQVYKALKPGGRLYVEDLFRHGEFDEDEQAHLSQMLYAQYLPYRETYVADLQGAGFAEIDFNDRTKTWRPYVAERVAAWTARRGELVAVHGEAIVDSLAAFYHTVSLLFESGKLGGVRLLATKP
ncbi:MAG: class I SAM-dependent methyltransferase [Rhizobiales bacterium]|nr:class I SAM-dependent methyltransferase [Hyphomicrobiales bacterium]